MVSVAGDNINLIKKNDPTVKTGNGTGSSLDIDLSGIASTDDDESDDNSENDDVLKYLETKFEIKEQ